jgi:general secretion pathway protein A
MIKMFKAYYGLTCNPFDKQNLKEKDFFESHDHKEMIARLNYLKEIRGIGVFTARPGMGKSFTLRCFAKSLNPSLYQMEYFCLSTISVTEFYRQLCTCLGVDINGGKTSMFKNLQERIYYLYKEKRKPLIIAIDEAQYLNSAILKDIKMLMNYGYDSLNCFSLILVGEPYLNNTLEKPVHEAFRQRITVHYNYEGLRDFEITDYITHKLVVAGGGKDIIEASAIRAIHGYSRGNPRLIDNLMTDVLILGAQMDKKSIDSDVIFAAINAQALN